MSRHADAIDAPEDRTPAREWAEGLTETMGRYPDATGTPGAVRLTVTAAFLGVWDRVVDPRHAEALAADLRAHIGRLSAFGYTAPTAYLWATRPVPASVEDTPTIDADHLHTHRHDPLTETR